MIRIGGLALPVDGDLDQLRKRAARTLGVRPGALGELDIVRQSIDARRKDDVHYVYTVELSMANEASMVRSAPGRNISLTERRPYAFPGVGRKAALPPVVVGMGPAEDKMQEIVAEVPMAEMGDFATTLRSVTHGRGHFSLEFTRYEEAPANVAEKVIEDAKAQEEV